MLRIVSSRRSLKLKGSLFREFNRRLRPLLDGKHTMDEVYRRRPPISSAPTICRARWRCWRGKAWWSRAPALTSRRRCADRLMPQLNYFHEMTDGGRDLQLRLASAQVAVLGLGGAGAMTAHRACRGRRRQAGLPRRRRADALGCLFLADLRQEEVGGKARRTAEGACADSAPQVEATALAGRSTARMISGARSKDADFVVSCLDEGMLNLAYKLNKVCLSHRMPWMCVALEGAEIVVGPAFHPPHGPCYMCYRMRAVACAGNPEATFAVEQPSRPAPRRISATSGKAWCSAPGSPATSPGSRWSRC